MLERNLFSHFQMRDGNGKTIGLTEDLGEAQAGIPDNGSVRMLDYGDHYTDASGNNVTHGQTDGKTHP